MKTITEIEAELKAARAQYDSYNNLQNEGATDGYNPHMGRIEDLAAELAEAKQAKVASILSGESLKAERAAFNDQGFTAPNKAQAWCLSRGYTLSDLMAAAKAANKSITHEPTKKMKNITLTQARVNYLKSLNLDGKIIESTGPRGGHRSENAIGTPSAGWTRAAHLAGFNSYPLWSGHLPTPSRGFAVDVVNAMKNAPTELQS